MDYRSYCGIPIIENRYLTEPVIRPATSPPYLGGTMNAVELELEIVLEYVIKRLADLEDKENTDAGYDTGYIDGQRAAFGDVARRLGDLLDYSAGIHKESDPQYFPE